MFRAAFRELIFLGEGARKRTALLHRIRDVRRIRGRGHEPAQRRAVSRVRAIRLFRVPKAGQFRPQAPEVDGLHRQPEEQKPPHQGHAACAAAFSYIHRS